MSRSLVVVQHGDNVGMGLLADVLEAAGMTPEVVRVDLGEPLPGVDRLGGLVVLGGSMGAYDEDEHPYLVDEKRLLREAVARAVPVLGICLGCQLLADALGGAAFLAPRLEARFASCALTAEGVLDPVVRHLSQSTLSLHEDTWEPPHGARVLAFSDRYPQAFRLGSALGIQTHPEVVPEVAAEWIEELGPGRITAEATDPAPMVEAMVCNSGASRRTAFDLFGAWLAEAGLLAEAPTG